MHPAVAFGDAQCRQPAAAAGAADAAAVAGLIGGAYWTYTQLPTSFIPEEDQGVLMTIITLPDGVTTLTRTTVLTEAMVTVGTIVQTVSNTELGGPVPGQYRDGNWTTSSTLTDVAGNISPASAGGFLLDTQGPSLPMVLLPESSNGVNAQERASGGNTQVTTVLPADAVAGDVVTTLVTKPDGSTLVLTTVLTAADIAVGRINQAIATSELNVDGTWTTSTTVTDLAGNTSAPRTGSFVLDTTPPSAPAAALAPASDSGTVGDSITADNTPSISGTGTAGESFTVSFPGGEVKTGVVAANGTWSVTPTTALPDGVNNITVTATDPAGNVSQPTALPITIDTTLPLAPTAALASVSDTGTLGDSLTNDNTPTLSGTGTPGDTITVKDAAGNVIATAVVGEIGRAHV